MLVDLIKTTLPDYTITLPSKKNKISFRPLLVKEEKFISIINELSPTTEDKIINLVNIVDSCCNNVISSAELPIYDFQLLLTEIRKKSVDEKSKMKITCPHTGEKLNVSVNLNDYHVHKEMSSAHSIEVSSELFLEFRSPTMNDLKEINGFVEDKTQLLELISLCLTKVETPNEKIDADQSSREDKLEFLEYLTKKDFREIKEFIMSSFISFEIAYTTSDDVTRKIEVRDFVNFLKFFLITLI
tara:strand:+ start:23 stop:751 length:729 start_codon:yes stop_codon:yes gene_type:complete